MSEGYHDFLHACLEANCCPPSLGELAFLPACRNRKDYVMGAFVYVKFVLVTIVTSPLDHKLFASEIFLAKRFYWFRNFFLISVFFNPVLWIQ